LHNFPLSFVGRYAHLTYCFCVGLESPTYLLMVRWTHPTFFKSLREGNVFNFCFRFSRLCEEKRSGACPELVSGTRQSKKYKYNAFLGLLRHYVSRNDEIKVSMILNQNKKFIDRNMLIFNIS